VRFLHARHGDERDRLVKDFPNPTEEQIREQLDGNLCRCTGYHNIVKAIKAASQTMRS